jgi:hypothetical protein
LEPAEKYDQIFYQRGCELFAELSTIPPPEEVAHNAHRVEPRPIFALIAGHLVVLQKMFRVTQGPAHDLSHFPYGEQEGEWEVYGHFGIFGEHDGGKAQALGVFRGRVEVAVFVGAFSYTHEEVLLV